jgi:hypothetical protein
MEKLQHVPGMAPRVVSSYPGRHETRAGQFHRRPRITRARPRHSRAVAGRRTPGGSDIKADQEGKTFMPFTPDDKVRWLSDSPKFAALASTTRSASSGHTQGLSLRRPRRV